MVSRLRITGAAVIVSVLGACNSTPAGPGPGPDLGLSGTVIVVNKQANTVSFIDLAEGRIVATQPTGNGPHELVVTSDGRTAVVSDYGRGGAGGNTLTVLDVGTASVVRTIDLGIYRTPHGMAFLPGEATVAVTSENTGNVVVVRISDGTIVSVLPTQAQGSHMVAVTADGARMYTGDISSNTVTELDAASEAKTRAFALPLQPEAVAVTPSGDRAFAGSNGLGLVSEIDLATGQVTQIASGFGFPYRIFLTPDVERMIIPDLTGGSVRILDGTSYAEEGRIAFPGEGPQGLILHPDGVHLFQSLFSSNRIAVIDIETRQVRGYLPAGGGPDGIGYSALSVGG